MQKSAISIVPNYYSNVKERIQIKFELIWSETSEAGS